MRIQLPIKTRLTLAFTVLLSIILGVSGTLFYIGFKAQLDETINDDVSSLTLEFVDDINKGESPILHDFSQSEAEDFFAQVLDSSGNIEESSPDTDGLYENSVTFHGAQELRLFEIEIAGSNDSDPIPVRVGIAPAADGRQVLAGRSLEERDEALHGFLYLLWISGPAILLVSAALSWFITKATLQPVERMRQAASVLSVDSLDQRLRVPDTGDEIARLGGTLNEMLARLEQSISKERRIIDDASHELRTPLAILKTELDLALRRSRTIDELRSALKNAADVSEELNRLAVDMLVLARANSGNLPLHKTPVDMSELAQRVTARFASRMRENHIRLDVRSAPGLVFEADEARLLQALSNMIDNAIGHSPDGGRVQVDIACTCAGELVISVADSGEGFPEEFIDSAFDPFTRVDAGRSRHQGGAGLGLAMVSSVARAHGGTATACNRKDGGALVSLHLPA